MKKRRTTVPKDDLEDRIDRLTSVQRCDCRLLETVSFSLSDEILGTEIAMGGASG